MGLMMDYVIALTHLYGLVHKDKVVEIYNMQNDEKIEVGDVESRAQDDVSAFDKHFVNIHGDYFVHDAILDFEDFEQELAKRQGKPFYIPAQKKLLKYKKDSYVEKPVEYMALRKYVQRNFFNGDADKAEILSEDVQGFCQYAFSISKVFESFDRSGVVFDGEEQVGEVMELVMDLANNTRLWENNGFTPNELSNQNLTPREKAEGTVVNKKIGRNEPCPCGSGKKYKKCCGA